MTAFSNGEKADHGRLLFPYHFSSAAQGGLQRSFPQQW